MSNEETQAVVQVAEQVRGDRGEVGTSSAGDRLKALWHAEGRGLSLKAFVKGLLKDNPDAKTWHANKRGQNNQKRSDANIASAKAAGAATKLERRKKKGEGK